MKRRVVAGMLPAAGDVGQRRLADFAFEYMRDLLLEGVLVAGDGLSAEEVGTRLGISRYPVMEALKRLDAEGYIRIVPQVGCIVTEPDPNEIADFYSFFALFEAEITALAAKRRLPEEVDALTLVSRRLGRFIEEAHSARESARAYRQLNRAFHSQIHLMSRSPAITRMADRFWDRSDFYIATVRGPQIFADRIRTAHEEHEAALQAIEAGDSRAARRWMLAHIRAIGKTVSARRGEAG